MKKNTDAFIALVRAGLWEKEARLSPFGDIETAEVIKLAEEQSVMGLVAAGFEHVKDTKISHTHALNIAGSTLQIEQVNTAMNTFVAELFNKMSDAGIKALLLKGQGIAQCYERPLWRASGDVDLLLDEDNYEKAKRLLQPLAETIEDEVASRKHLGLTISGWTVELHGTLRGSYFKRVNRELDFLQQEIYRDNKNRIWLNGSCYISLPAPDENVIIVFTHIHQHFTQGGIGLRQICDWCRLLWNYRKVIDLRVLEERIQRMGLHSEWGVFAALAVEYLGMPQEAMPLYSSSKILQWKAKRLLSYVLETGNFGHNRDNSYRREKSLLKVKLISLKRNFSDGLKQFLIFPIDSVKVFGKIFFFGVIRTVREKKWVR